MKMQDIPVLDRPREKAVRYGPESLTDAELLSIIINHGFQGSNALDIANEILSQSHGLYHLNDLNEKELRSIKGIDRVRALQLMSLFTIMERIKRKKIELQDGPVDTEFVYKKYSDYLSSLNNEIVILLVLNRQKKIKFEKTLYVGSHYMVSVEVNEIIKNVIAHDGYYFYLIHNHPGGNGEPSPQDILLTFRLNETIKGMKIYLVDHLIIYDGGYSSINEYLSKEYNYRRLLTIPTAN